MSLSATAHAQADDALAKAEAALDEAASAFKRQARAARDGLVASSRARDAVRQARLNNVGIVIETTAQEGADHDQHHHTR